jgi:hypothetical protein
MERTVNDDLRTLIHGKLTSEGLSQKNWSRPLIAAWDGRDALESLLKGEQAPESAVDAVEPKKHAGAFLASLSVQGFRGIGPKETLTFTAGPGRFNNQP